MRKKPSINILLVSNVLKNILRIKHNTTELSGSTSGIIRDTTRSKVVWYNPEGGEAA